MRPGCERHRAPGAAEGVHDGAQQQHQHQRAHGDVEPGDLVVGPHAGPAPGGRADEIGSEVVPDGEARDAGDLRRVPGRELVGQADVERGVRRDERVELERAVGRLAVAAVLRDGQQRDDRDRRCQGSAQRRPLGEAEADPAAPLRRRRWPRGARGPARGGRRRDPASTRPRTRRARAGPRAPARPAGGGPAARRRPAARWPARRRRCRRRWFPTR